MNEVRHAIVQCYVKEPLLYHFTMSDVEKRGVLCQSNWSAMTSCPGWFLCGHLLHYASSLHNTSHRDIKGRFHETSWVNMDLLHSGALDQWRFSFQDSAFWRELMQQGYQGRGSATAANTPLPLKIHIQVHFQPNHGSDKQSEWNTFGGFCFEAKRLYSALTLVAFRCLNQLANNQIP